MAKVTKEKKTDDAELTTVEAVSGEPTLAEEIAQAVPVEDAADMVDRIDSNLDLFVSSCRRLMNINDEPRVSIKGTVCNPVEIPREKWADYGLDHFNYRRDNNILTLPVNNANMAQYTYEHLSSENVKFYVLQVGHIEVIMSSGSSLVLKQGFVDDAMSEFGDIPPSRATRLTLIGSGIEARDLEVQGKNILNNTIIDVEKAVCLVESKISAAAIISVETAAVVKTTLNSTRFMYTKCLHISESYLSDLSIQGTEYTEFRNCKCYSGRHVAFSFNHLNKPRFKVTSQLFGHEGHHYASFGKKQPDLSLSITRRIDYGYFIALDNIPFIRANHKDILVGGMLFTAAELFSQFEKETPKPSFTPINPIGGYYPVPEVRDGWTSTLRNGELWNRVAKLVFQDEPLLGKGADKVIMDLIAQIKSRVEIYIELDNLGIENGRNYQY